MVYSILLLLHSWLRWLILIGLLTSIYRSSIAWKKGLDFSPTDERLRLVTLIFSHLQLLIGLALYWASPLIQYFLSHFQEAVHQREIRFFGMEHNLTMIFALVLVTVVSSRVKRINDSSSKHKTLVIGFSLVLLLIFIAIPWPFSPLVARPWLRF